MSPVEPLSRADAERRYSAFDRLARRRRRLRRFTQAVSGGLSAFALAGALVWVGLGLSGLRQEETPASGIRATAVSAGGFYTCALTTSGGVKCWGDNTFGQLGDGTQSRRALPVDVVGLSSGVAAISAGVDHICALTTAGGVKCWGWNYRGKLGDGSTTRRPTPVDVVGLSSGVAAITAGDVQTCALTTSGGVKCWGGGTGNHTPVDVVGLSSGVAAISAGGYHTCALTTSGGVKCWGVGTLGSTPWGETVDSTPVDVVGLTSGVAAISAGSNHTCALTTSGGVKCWGSNENGRLGNGSKADSVAPVDVVGLSSGVAAVSAGANFTCALTTSGGVKCWGFNGDGQLGNGTTESSSTPVDVVGLSSGVAAISAGGSHACALTTDGVLKCWGDNQTNQLGDGTREDRPTPVHVAGLRPDAP